METVRLSGGEQVGAERPTRTREITAPGARRRSRLMSFDVVRGITIAFMINNNGGARIVAFRDPYLVERADTSGPGCSYLRFCSWGVGGVRV